MTTLSYSRWDPPVSTGLPDLEGCIADILDAIDFAARLEAGLSSKPHDYVLLDAYSTALIIRYARSFKQGRRTRLQLTDELRFNAEERAVHERVLAIRDKHVSHPINRLETHSVFVGFDPSAGDRARATAVSSGTRTQIPLSLEEVRVIQSLCGKWYAMLRTQQVAECERLLPLAKALTAAQLHGLPVGPVEPHMDPLKERTQRRR